MEEDAKIEFVAKVQLGKRNFRFRNHRRRETNLRKHRSNIFDIDLIFAPGKILLGRPQFHQNI